MHLDQLDEYKFFPWDSIFKKLTMNTMHPGNLTMCKLHCFFEATLQGTKL